MSASPALSLIERAAEVYGYEDAWLRPAAAARPAEPVVPLAPPEPATMAVEGSAASEARAEPIVRRLSERLRQPSASVARLLAEEPVAPERTAFVRPDAPPSVLSEEFRLAKRAPLAAAFGRPGQDPVARGRLLLVASANPGEGKTFCAANLALSLAAERDLRVLLVDGDVAKPSLPQTLELTADGEGLLDAIADPTLDPETLMVPAGPHGLALLPAGRPVNDATELLGSAAARALFDRLIEADPRRLVVIDSPPLLAASPALSLALHVGQAVLVVRADRTAERELADAYALIDRVPAVHLLLNGVSFASGRTRPGSYYGVGE